MIPDLPWEPKLGAVCEAGGTCRFTVWAPDAEEVSLHLVAPQDCVIPMQRAAGGYHTLTLEGVEPGARYLYRLGGVERPDPASRSQPEGVHGPSEVVGGYPWQDAGWPGVLLEDYVIYELHVGAFTPEGTFDAIIPHLDDLAALGVTAVEIMPVAEFPGARNWGYDGASLYAVESAYGGPDAFKRLVDACHARGLAVMLDVVYNHLGPEGNYLRAFGPYFTERYHTPWGDALNFDGPHSDEVRRFFVENALMWVTEYHVDGLRLDATHVLFDFSARTFLEELIQVVHEQARHLNRRVVVIAESDRSDDRLLRPRALGGYGIDAQWSDDLHHALHTLITGDDSGYYEDFGGFSQLVAALRRGFVYSGGYSPFRQRTHGSFGADLPASSFVVCTQNHDQVGNRMNGERLGHLASFAEQKLAAGMVLLSPYIPLLFMGEEYGEPAPFLFFTSFEDPALGEAVTGGRREEFAGHRWEGEAPDPQAVETFERSKLDLSLRREGHHGVLLGFYTALLRLRRTIPALRRLDKDRMDVTGYERERVLVWRRWYDESEVAAAFNFSDEPQTLALPLPAGEWHVLLHSEDARWQPAGEAPPGPAPGPIAADGPAQVTLGPKAFVLYGRGVPAVEETS